MPTKTKDINEKNRKKITTSKTAKKKNSTKKSVTQKSNSKSKKIINSTQKPATPTKKKSTSKDLTSKKISQKPTAEIIEYYDLPYRYNETIVKVLYQTPDTLFVYWDISDLDRENYIKQYGEDFFTLTRPVLIVYNDTMNYSFEIAINDFANSWYLHINDSKCNYRVELGRRPNYYNQESTQKIKENIKTDYIYVTSSNKIESPNNKVLFSTNNNNTVKFRNIKNHEEQSISLYNVIKNLPTIEKSQNIPYINEKLLQHIYSKIYQNEDISSFDKIKNNPSSGGNPSSGNMSSKFI